MTVTVAIVNDYAVVVDHLRRSLMPYADRVLVVDTAIGNENILSADIALFDTTGGLRRALSRARELVDHGSVGHVVMHATRTPPGFIDAAHRIGVSDILPRDLEGEQLVMALEAIASGRHPPEAYAREDDDEWELLALLGVGLSNEQIADELYVSRYEVRRRLHRLYRRLGLPGRAAAADRARELGLTPRDLRATDHLYGARVAAKFRRVPAEIASARAFTRQALEQRSAPPETVDALVLVVSELAANVIVHGTGPTWSVGVKATATRFEVDVAGGAVDAESIVFHPERWAIADPQQRSGRGLGIVRSLTDDVAVDLWRGKVRVRCAIRQT